MDLTSGLLVLVSAVGAGVAVYGVSILVTGRATPGDRRAFRRLAEGGRYYLCFGLALALMASGSLLNRHGQTAVAMVALLVAIVLTGLAVIRYRPRRSRRQ